MVVQSDYQGEVTNIPVRRESNKKFTEFNNKVDKMVSEAAKRTTVEAKVKAIHDFLKKK